MCFHSNQHPWATKHHFISLYSKYQSLKYICLPVMNFPVFPSLDNIYCIFSPIFIACKINSKTKKRGTSMAVDMASPNMALI